MALSMESPAQEFEDFDRLVRQHRTRVLRFLLASLGDKDLAESLTQDCFWNAYKSRATFRGECSVDTWLIRIAVNLVRNQLRTRRYQFWKKAQRVDTEHIERWADQKISPEERASVNEQVHSIWKAASSLSDRQRTVFLLRYLEELDIHEIASATGLTPSSVHVHLRRAVDRIRRSLGKRK